MAFVTSADGLSWLLACSLKAGVLLAASWGGALVLRRAPAAARHQIWTLGVIGALLLPLLCWLVPTAVAALSVSSPLALTTTSLVAPAMLVTAGAAPVTAPTWPTWLAMAWAIGAFAVVIRIARGHLAAQRLTRTATAEVPDAWRAAHREAAAALALEHRATLLCSDRVRSPMTIGIVRPRVLLPAIAEAWSSGRLRAVLVHELGHVQRRDTAIQLAAGLACALYWWNPLAWHAAARLRVEREHACDDLVLEAGVLPSSYATDLLDVARALGHGGPTAAICMVDGSSTASRLQRVLDGSAPRGPLRARFRVAALALALVSTVTLACTADAPPAIDAAPSAPATLGVLAVGAPFVREPPGEFVREAALAPRGELDLSLVAAEVNRRLGRLEQCYERRLAAKPGLAGTVVIHWVIDETGKVPESCITTDTVLDHDISNCVNQLVASGPFPAPHGAAVDVSFPFEFRPRAGR